ncbi:hypothetical protein TRV_02151 [Trichophyton verrucosum HKI 0517]|uniref:Uncharacterized protein n=1 Tax=Trichophyton verrucosum (strain HKI 0517) TaxID=663202 RepID=D4D4Y3_TRIVH|nr:uncharacterized protein TRV_02151 [Trichophyton verrucosum HKI 0517]EFE43099.1 hypothetical protein TRV_02151 [Trichophyton verrucosum HKI 0517]
MDPSERDNPPQKKKRRKRKKNNNHDDDEEKKQKKKKKNLQKRKGKDGAAATSDAGQDVTGTRRVTDSSWPDFNLRLLRRLLCFFVFYLVVFFVFFYFFYCLSAPLRNSGRRLEVGPERCTRKVPGGTLPFLRPPSGRPALFYHQSTIASNNYCSAVSAVQLLYCCCTTRWTVYRTTLADDPLIQTSKTPSQTSLLRLQATPDALVDVAHGTAMMDD